MKLCNMILIVSILMLTSNGEITVNRNGAVRNKNSKIDLSHLIGKDRKPIDHLSAKNYNDLVPGTKTPNLDVSEDSKSSQSSSEDKNQRRNERITTYQNPDFLEHSRKGIDSTQNDILPVLCVLSFIAISAIIFVSCSIIYCVRIRRINNILTCNEVTFEDFRCLTPQNRQIAYNNALDIFEAGDFSSRNNKYKFENALHIIIQYYQWNHINSETHQDSDLNKLLREYASKLAKCIIEESFDGWLDYILSPEKANSFALLHLTRYAKISRQSFQGCKFIAKDTESKFKEALLSLKQIFNIIDDKVWARIDKINHNYPAQHAIGLMMNNKDLGVSEAINAVMFLDVFYTSTGLSINIPKSFTKIHISNKIIDFERNIKSIYKFAYLYKELNSESNLYCCTKQLPFENLIRNAEIEKGKAIIHNFKLAGSNITVPCRNIDPEIARSHLKIVSSVSTQLSNSAIHKFNDYEQDSKEPMNIKNYFDSKRTSAQHEI